MANALYDKGREGFLAGDISWRDDTIRCLLLDAADYAPDLAAHDFLNDVPVAARVGAPQILANKAVAAGVADADDVTFPNVAGDPCEYLLLYQDTGNEATSRLIALLDTAAGLPVTPNGGNIVVQWDNGANRIFKL